MNIILFDDEPLALDYLEQQLSLVRKVNIIGKYSHLSDLSVKENIKLADAVFLDIKMSELNELELAEEILKLNPNLPIIFVTAYAKYAIKAFELNALDYLLKPVQLERLKKTVQRIEVHMKYKCLEALETSGHLKIHVMGKFTFQLNKNEPKIITWRTTNTQELFLYLLHNHDNFVTNSELIELLFPHIEMEKAYSLLYVTIYQVRQALSDYSKYINITNIQNGYVLKLNKNTSIDKEVWKEDLIKAPKIDITTIDQHEKIMSQYKGPYIGNQDYIWAEGERYRLEKIWLDHALKMAKHYYNHQNFEKAAMWYVEISDVIPEEESVSLALMKIYALKGYGLLVDHQYNILKNSLGEFNLPLSDGVKKWYHDWKLSKTKLSHSK